VKGRGRAPEGEVEEDRDRRGRAGLKGGRGWGLRDRSEGSESGGLG